jgi:hypothetical protein
MGEWPICDSGGGGCPRASVTRTTGGPPYSKGADSAWGSPPPSLQDRRGIGRLYDRTRPPSRTEDTIRPVEAVAHRVGHNDALFSLESDARTNPRPDGRCADESDPRPVHDWRHRPPCRSCGQSHWPQSLSAHGPAFPTLARTTQVRRSTPRGARRPSMSGGRCHPTDVQHTFGCPPGFRFRTCIRFAPVGISSYEAPPSPGRS